MVFQMEDCKELHGLFRDLILFLDIFTGPEDSLRKIVPDMHMIGNLHIINDGQLRKKADVLESPGHPQLRDLIGFLAIDADPIKGDIPFCRDVDPCNKVKGRCLAGPVWSDETDEFVFIDMHGKVRNGTQSAKNDGDIIKIEEAFFYLLPS